MYQNTSKEALPFLFYFFEVPLTKSWSHASCTGPSRTGPCLHAPTVSDQRVSLDATCHLLIRPSGAEPSSDSALAISHLAGPLSSSRNASCIPLQRVVSAHGISGIRNSLRWCETNQTVPPVNCGFFISHCEIRTDDPSCDQRSNSSLFSPQFIALGHTWYDASNSDLVPILRL